VQPSKTRVPALVAALILLVIWQIAALVIGQDIILVAPWQVVTTLVTLVPQPGFWATVAHSLLRIVAGFVGAYVLGVLSAWAASRNRWVGALLGTLMRLIRSIPVVSFIILLLIWANSTWLSLWVAGLMVLPIIYANAEEGFAARDPKLTAMADVFGFTPVRRWWAITLPGLMPFLVAAARVGFGLAWKAGVSAEVIGLPTGSIGDRLYQAKLYLSTADLFAWTAVIVTLSYLCEKAILLVLRAVSTALGRYGTGEPRLAPPTQVCDPVTGVRFRNVRFLYGDTPVLSGLTFDCPAGGTVWLDGANGTGKTTTLHLALGLLTPASGEVTPAASARSAVFQEDRLCDHLTAVANVRLGLGYPAPTAAIITELARAGVTSDLTGRPVGQLSGGQRRRVALVRALMRPAGFLCLDEPYTGIDEASLDGVVTYTLERIHDRAVLLVCHDATVAARFHPRRVPLRTPAADRHTK